MKYDYLIVGAGFAGSVFAERLASQLNKKVIVVEKRNHIGGNAYDEYDEHGVLVHKYGPHIFHTNSKNVFDYLSLFTKWIPYEHRVLAKLNGELYPIPINRLTINKLYKKNFSNEKEVNQFLNSIREKRYPVTNSEDIIVNKIGCDLFAKFFKNYTKKQWDLYPHELAASVCGRIPVRTKDDSRYFTDKFQFMPKRGYTKMFENILSHHNIEVVLNTDYKKIIDNIIYDKMVYTGPIDYFFNYKYGKLPYRSIRFEFEHYNMESFQVTAQVNYVDATDQYTRVIEHKKLSSQSIPGTTVSREYPLFKGEPFYPIPNKKNRKRFNLYKLKSMEEKNTLFCGRLAEYQYYNMDQVVANTLIIFQQKI